MDFCDLYFDLTIDLILFIHLYPGTIYHTSLNKVEYILGNDTNSEIASLHQLILFAILTLV